MTFFHDPPLPAWVAPTESNDLEPLPALLHRESEHEITVTEYDRKEKRFKATRRERRAKAFKRFEDCAKHMLSAKADALMDARHVANDLASQVNHLHSLREKPFPEYSYEENNQEKTLQEKAEGEVK